MLGSGQKGVGTCSFSSSIKPWCYLFEKGPAVSPIDCPVLSPVEGFNRCVHFHGSEFKTFQSFNRRAPFKSSKANECNARFKDGITNAFVAVIAKDLIVNGDLGNFQFLRILKTSKCPSLSPNRYFHVSGIPETSK
jgi:hypothetical protein